MEKIFSGNENLFVSKKEEILSTDQNACESKENIAI
jgi:hypothetical protein